MAACAAPRAIVRDSDAGRRGRSPWAAGARRSWPHFGRGGIVAESRDYEILLWPRDMSDPTLSSPRDNLLMERLTRVDITNVMDGVGGRSVEPLHLGRDAHCPVRRIGGVIHPQCVRNCGGAIPALGDLDDRARAELRVANDQHEGGDQTRGGKYEGDEAVGDEGGCQVDSNHGDHRNLLGIGISQPKRANGESKIQREASHYSSPFFSPALPAASVCCLSAAAP